MLDEICLDAKRWRTRDDFFEDLFAALGEEGRHLRNVDVLVESMTGGDVDRRKPPILIRITGVDSAPAPVRKLIRTFEDLLLKAEAEGHRIHIVCLGP